MPTRRRVLVAVAVLSLTAGCTGTDDPAPVPSPSRSAAPSIPALATAWKAPFGQAWTPDPNSPSASSWTTPGAIVVPADRSLTSVATADGSTRWTAELPGSLCSISDAPNEDSIAAFVLTKGTDNPKCLVAGAIDTATGRVLWTRQLATTLSDVGADLVQIGPKVVTVSDTCTAAVSLAVTDGSTIRRFPSGTTTPGSCGDSFAGDGRIVVDGRERNGRDGQDALIGSDAVSGRRLWSVPVAPDKAFPSPNIRLSRVVSSDPVVADAEVNGHRFLRIVDPSTGRATVFGREADRTTTPLVFDLPGNVLAVQYTAGLLFAFDADTGALRRRTVLQTGERALGVRNGEVITTFAPSSVATVGLQIVRAVDPVAGTAAVLGSVRAGGLRLMLAGDRIVGAGTIGSDFGLTAYRVPTRPPAGVALPAPATVAPGDLAMRDTAELCLGVSTTTKRALGFVQPGLPIRADCNFFESRAGNDFLQVRPFAFVSTPAGGRSADEAARRRAVELMAADTVNSFPAMTPLAGLGDQAGIASRASRGGPFVRLVARRANVVVVVDLSLSGASAGKADLPRLAKGARLVAADLVAEVDRRRR